MSDLRLKDPNRKRDITVQYNDTFRVVKKAPIVKGNRSDFLVAKETLAVHAEDLDSIEKGSLLEKIAGYKGLPNVDPPIQSTMLVTSGMFDNHTIVGLIKSFLALEENE